MFIVDLKNKMFVFLDSYFDSNANFQIDASSKLESLFYVILISFSGLSLYLVCTLPIFFVRLLLSRSAGISMLKAIQVWKISLCLILQSPNRTICKSCYVFFF